MINLQNSLFHIFFKLSPYKCDVIIIINNFCVKHAFSHNTNINVRSLCLGFHDDGFAVPRLAAALSDQMGHTNRTRRAKKSKSQVAMGRLMILIRRAALAPKPPFVATRMSGRGYAAKASFRGLNTARRHRPSGYVACGTSPAIEY